MNKVLFTGRLTKDPELRMGGQDNGVAVVHFNLAINRKFRKEGQPNADFANMVAFGKIAEFIEKNFKQGQKIEVECRFQSGSYKDKDGKTVYTNVFVCDNVDFGESKKESENAGNSYNSNASNSSTGQESLPNVPTPEDVDGFSADSELPFNF